MLFYLNQLCTCVNFPKKGEYYVMDNSIGLCSAVEPRYPQLMSLGTGATKSWWGPRENTRHNTEVPWQPCEREPALQATNNQKRHTKGTSVKKLT